MATLVGQLHAILGMDTKGFRAGTVVATQSMRAMQAAAANTSTAMAGVTVRMTAATMATRAFAAATSVGGLAVITLIAYVVQHARTQNEALKVAAAQRQKDLTDLREAAQKIKIETREMARDAAIASAAARTIIEARQAALRAQLATPARGPGEIAILGGTPVQRGPSSADRKAIQQSIDDLENLRQVMIGVQINTADATREFDKLDAAAAQTAGLKAQKTAVEELREAIEKWAKAQEAARIALLKMDQATGMTLRQHSKDIREGGGVRLGVPAMPVLPGGAIDAQAAGEELRKQINESGLAQAAEDAADGLDHVRAAGIAMLAGIVGSRTEGPVGGALSGGLSGLASGDPLAAFSGALVGFMDGMFEQTERAIEARNRMREATRDFGDSIDDLIRGTQVAAGQEGFARLASELEGLQKQFMEATGVFGASVGSGSIQDFIRNAKAARDSMSDNAATVAAWDKVIEYATISLEALIAAQAALAATTRQDLEVRLLAARGYTDAAEALQRQLDMERELAALREELGEAFTADLEALYRLVKAEEDVARAKEKERQATEAAARAAEDWARAAREAGEAAAASAARFREAQQDFMTGLTDRLVAAGLMSEADAQKLKADALRKQAAELGLPDQFLNVIEALLAAEGQPAGLGGGGGELVPDKRNQAIHQAAQSISSTQALLITHQLTTSNVYLAEIAANTKALGMGVSTGTFNAGPTFQVQVTVQGDVFADSAYAAGRRLARGAADQINEDLGTEMVLGSWPGGSSTKH